MIETFCNYKSDSMIPFKDVEAPLSNRIARLGDEVSDFVPNGYQAIIEIDDSEIASRNSTTDFPDPKHPVENPTVFHLHVALGTSGSFAKAKMYTLKNWTADAATGDMTIEELLNLIRLAENYDENDPMLQEISQLENASQLLRRHHEWLRDLFSITVFAGGIRVPFTTKGGFKGEIRITFSALTEEQDICMCILILRQLQLILKEILKAQDDWAEYDLSKLKENKRVNFHMAQYRVDQIVV